MISKHLITMMEDISLHSLCLALLWDQKTDHESTGLTSFRNHQDVHHFHLHFLCIDKELIQITFALHLFTDWIFSSATWRLFYWACQKASPGGRRVPATHRLQEPRRSHEAANLWIKGYRDSNLLTGLYWFCYCFIATWPVLIQICCPFPILARKYANHFTSLCSGFFTFL